MTDTPTTEAGRALLAWLADLLPASLGVVEYAERDILAIETEAYDKGYEEGPGPMPYPEADVERAVAAERERISEKAEEHRPIASTEMDDSPVLSCSCGWEDEPWKRRALGWYDHLRLAIIDGEATDD